MNEESARKLLDDESDGRETRHVRFERKRAALQKRILDAQTEGLKSKFTNALEELESAYEFLELADAQHELGYASVRQKSGKPLPRKRFGAALAAVALMAFVVAATCGPTIRKHWNAHGLYATSHEAALRKDLKEALRLAHQAVLLAPESADYAVWKAQCVQNLLDYQSDRFASMRPSDILHEFHDLAQNHRDELGHQGMLQLRDIFKPYEKVVLDDLKAAFKSDLQAIEQKLGQHPEELSTLVAPDSRATVDEIVSACANLRSANSARDRQDYDVLANTLRKIPTAYQGPLFASLNQSLKFEINRISKEVLAANALVAEHKFSEARDKLDALKSAESWIDGLETVRTNTIAKGEDYYTGRMMASICSHDLGATQSAFKNLRSFQRLNADFDCAELLKPQTTDHFLTILTGLKFETGLVGQHFITAAVASNEANLVDASVAEKFLSENYLKWAEQSAVANQWEEACYLALLAQKHGNDSASNRFNSFLASLTKTVPARIVFESPRTPSKGRDVAEAVLSATEGDLQKSAPPWMAQVETPGVITEGVLDIRVTAGVSDYAVDHQELVKDVAPSVSVDVTSANPEYAKAVAAVTQAAGAVQGQASVQGDDAAVLGVTGQAASQLESQVPGLSMFNSLLSTGVQATDQSAVSAAQAELREKQRVLAATPKQITTTEVRTIPWKQTEHLTKFTATYRLMVKVGASKPWEKQFKAEVLHKALEQKANPQYGIAEIPREQPDIDQINSALSGQLIKQVDRFIMGVFPSVLKQLTVSEMVANASGEEERQTALLRASLLWWQTPLRNLSRLTPAVFSAKYGDALPIGGPDSRGLCLIKSLAAGSTASIEGMGEKSLPFFESHALVGRHGVVVRAAGFEDWSGELEINENEFTELNVNLVRSTGGLSVRANLEGAEYSLYQTANEQSVQKGKLPADFKALPTGSYVLVAHHSGVADVKRNLDIPKGESVNCTVEFEFGKLEASSTPSGAEVKRDGVVLGMLDRKGWLDNQAPKDDIKLSEQSLKNEFKPFNINDLDLTMLPIPSGSFRMGDESMADTKPITTVTFAKAFWLGKTEVTQAQWQRIMGNNPSRFKGADLPVEQVSWDEAMAFCRKLTDREQAAGRLPAGYIYTLPTEAQWEYACRAGTTDGYGGDLDAQAWYGHNSGSTTHPVAGKQANALGLYDMHGNVWEWCADWYGDYSGGSITDPTGTASGSERVFRGGSYFSGDSLFSRVHDLRSDYRSKKRSDTCYDVLGFRLALSSSGGGSAEFVKEQPGVVSFPSGASGDVQKASLKDSKWSAAQRDLLDKIRQYHWLSNPFFPPVKTRIYIDSEEIVHFRYKESEFSAEKDHCDQTITKISPESNEVFLSNPRGESAILRLKLVDQRHLRYLWNNACILNFHPEL